MELICSGLDPMIDSTTSVHSTSQGNNLTDLLPNLTNKGYLLVPLTKKKDKILIFNIFKKFS